MTTRSSPNKITFVVVDITKAATSKITSPTQAVSTPLLPTDIEKQTTTEITTAETSNVTPPPRILDDTPLSKKETSNKETETMDRADQGSKKRLAFEHEGNNDEEEKAKIQ
ncbi:hypothetical protein L2E82_35789 [Cichorium intybus]|uniref:Uncharacterized protein n=1 Tax=Cichorium intybus TaxID=13427 RepID=A0ACB9BPU8_CICIN|nr:hypothetical protein L2E82_35789 [Cichorium intybus]